MIKEEMELIKDVQNGIEALADSKGTEAAALENMAVILDKCTEKPMRIPSYLSQIKDGITTLSAWMRDNRDQPLEIDYIEFASADREFSSCDEKLGKSLKFGLDAFIGSFFPQAESIKNPAAMTIANIFPAFMNKTAPFSM